MADNLKKQTARAVKWNAIDRLLTQVLYAVTGIVLARLLSPEDFGLVGAVLIFQAFASLLIDSGFSFALLQRKSPSRLDYSSVLWLNMGIAVLIYIILYLAAPWIADLFQGDRRLVPLSRLMFLTFILNASAIVQVNRLTKQLNARPIAVANAAGLCAGGAVGIWLAVEGCGAWAIVWQSIAISGVKSLVLWTVGDWRPLMCISVASLRGFFKVGSGMMLTSFLSILFNNIYSFLIGNRAGLAPLGYYTQADKWSKMGVSSITQTITSAFVPGLSDAQDQPRRFASLCSKMNRAVAYVAFPCMIWLAVMATPVFHLLFGEKWDVSVPLFQLLLLRGLFVILTTLHTDIILAVGRSRLLVYLESVRDGLSLLLLLAALPLLGWSTPSHPALGIELLLCGQVLAAAFGWILTLHKASCISGVPVGRYILDYLPYLGATLAVSIILYCIGTLGWSPVITLALQVSTAVALYVAANALSGSRIQADVIAYLRGRL